MEDRIHPVPCEEVKGVAKRIDRFMDVGEQTEKHGFSSVEREHP
jgi:hypothetical protein